MRFSIMAVSFLTSVPLFGGANIVVMAAVDDEEVNGNGNGLLRGNFNRIIVSSPSPDVYIAS